MAKSKFYLAKETEGIIGMMGSLSQSLPDERPLTAIAIVENSSKCPEGFFPVLKTYDEDSDADLWKQQAIFGKRTCRYLCLSKSENISLFKMTGILISNVGEITPSGYSLVSITSDSNKPAWRRKQLCCMLTIDPKLIKNQPLLTDIIICSRLKKAPLGFQYAGEINGMLICYKTGINSAANALLHKVIEKDDINNYENVLPKLSTPEIGERLVPERPPKVSAHVVELNRLNLQNNKSPLNDNNSKKSANVISPNDDYEILSPSYNLQPSRPAPPTPQAPPVPPRDNPHSISNFPLPCAYSSYTLGNWNALEGIKFSMNPNLKQSSNNQFTDLPNIKRMTLVELDKKYCYNFNAERQT